MVAKSAPSSSKPKLAAVPLATVKRKDAPREDENEDEDVDDEDDDEDDDGVVNVDFDFYNLNADVDQIAVKRLLRQTLSHDDQLIDVHPLASLILSEGIRMSAGSSIKTDGEESDPWGLVAIIDIERNKDDPAFKPFLDYLISTLPPSSPLRPHLQPASSSTRTAMLFSLRLLNLPLPLIPALYKMLLSELATATKEQSDVPAFSNFVIWGRGYRIEGFEEPMGLEMDGRSAEVAPKAKKSKKTRKASSMAASEALAAGSYSDHPEDELFLDAAAEHIHTYPLKSAPPRDAESFGYPQYGKLALFQRKQLEAAVEKMVVAAKG